MLQSFPSVRLVALDLDGTLLSRSNEVTPATREAIAAGDKAAAEAARDELKKDYGFCCLAGGVRALT